MDILIETNFKNFRYSRITGQGEFLQFSGIQVEYNLSSKPFSRVQSVNVLCSNCKVPEFLPLNKMEEYTILMTSYIYGGGDGFQMFAVIKFLFFCQHVFLFHIRNILRNLLKF